MTVDKDLVAAIAAQVEERLAARMGREAPSRVPERTVGELWAEYFPLVEKKPGGRNKRSDRRMFDLRFRYDGRDVSLAELTTSELTPHALEAWRAALASYRKGNGEQLALATRQRVRMTLQSMFTYFVRVGSVPGLVRNPVAPMPPEAMKFPERQGYFTEEDFDQFCSHCIPVVAALLRVSFRCGGLRNAEVRLLRKSEVLWQTKEMTLKQKGGGFKTVIIPDAEFTLIEHWAAIAPGEYVFPNPRDPHGGPLSQSALWKAVDRARRSWGKRLGPTNENPTTHHTRHGYTMAMLEKGAPEGWVSQQLGHKSLAQMARYGRLRGRARDMMRDLANKTVAQVEAERRRSPKE